MKISILALVATTALVSGCGDSSKPGTAANEASNVVTAPLTYIGAVGEAQKYAEKQIDVSYINEDIQMFNASEGRYPKDLQEMIPTYLGKMPEVPQGYKLDYDTTTHTVKVVKQ